MRLLLIFFSVTFAALASAQTNGQPIIHPVADSLYFKNAWAEAIPYYEKAVNSGQKTPVLFYRLGLSYFQIGKSDKAISMYYNCLLQHPNPNLARVTQINLAKIYSQKNQIDSASHLIRSAMTNGYVNINDLETAPEYENYRTSKAYLIVKDEMYKAAFPCATQAEARWFDFWVGDWKAYVTGTNNLAGISTIEKIAGECAILENWSSNGGSFSGKSINFYNAQTKKWEQHWIGSAGGYQKFENGEYTEDAMRFTFTRINADQTTSLGRFIFYNQGSDQVRQFSESSNDEGKTWVVDYDFTYLREKSKKM